AHLAGTRQDRILQIGCSVRSDLGVDPAGCTVTLLAKYGRPEAISSQRAAKDVDVHLEALVRRLRRRVPIGDDDAAEWIGRNQRHERHGVERSPPQEAVDPDAARARRFGVAWLLGSTDRQTARAEH